MTPLRFLRAWALFTVGLLTAAAALNLVVDPYAVWGTPTIAGLTRDKPEAVNMPRLAKPYLVERAHAQTLLLGSSRIDIGMDSTAAVWPAARRPVFNLGVPATDPEAQARLLSHAQATANPGLIVAGINFDDSIAVPHVGGVTAQASAYYELLPRLRTDADGRPNPEYWRTRIRDAVASLLTLSATGDSLSTLLNQGAAETARMTDLGYNTGAGFLRLARTDGEWRLFTAKEAEVASKFLRVARQPGFDVEALARLLEDARGRGAEVLVMITPGYVDELELVRMTGLAPLRDRWTRQVAAIVAEAQRKGTKVQLWDFSAPSAYTTEALPAAGDTHTPTRWFWELDHFKPVLGEMMVARMLGGGPADLGTRLDGADLDATLAASAARLQRYEVERPDDVARVARIVAGVRAELCRQDAATCNAAVASR